MFASMIFKKEPFFHGHDSYDQGNMYVTADCEWGHHFLFSELSYNCLKTQLLGS